MMVPIKTTSLALGATYFAVILLLHTTTWVSSSLSSSCLEANPDPTTAACTAHDEVAQHKEDQEKQLLEWLLSKGGYFNPKQVLRHGEDGLFGVFAAQDIAKREILAWIPWNCIIRFARRGRFQKKNCDNVRLLAGVLKDKETGIFPALLRDTIKRHAAVLPAHWSDQGQMLLLKVTGHGTGRGKLPPEDPLLREFEWKNRCDLVDKDATLLIMTHGEDIGLVPITDRYNSRGGNWTGAYFSKEGGKDVALEIRAKRDLKQGEQIYTDYRDYGEVTDLTPKGEVGTPELLRDYGFVEHYPQRYVFPSHGIAFNVIQMEDDTLHVQWHPNGHPSRQALAFLEEQLARLTEVDEELQTVELNEKNGIPASELQVIRQFCKYYMKALELSVK